VTFTRYDYSLEKNLNTACQLFILLTTLCLSLFVPFVSWILQFYLQLVYLLPPVLTALLLNNQIDFQFCLSCLSNFLLATALKKEEITAESQLGLSFLLHP